jgi:hypothetical protein
MGTRDAAGRVDRIETAGSRGEAIGVEARKLRIEDRLLGIALARLGPEHADRLRQAGGCLAHLRHARRNLRWQLDPGQGIAQNKAKNAGGIAHGKAGACPASQRLRDEHRAVDLEMIEQPADILDHGAAPAPVEIIGIAEAPLVVSDHAAVGREGVDLIEPARVIATRAMDENERAAFAVRLVIELRALDRAVWHGIILRENECNMPPLRCGGLTGERVPISLFSIAGKYRYGEDRRV